MNPVFKTDVEKSGPMMEFLDQLLTLNMEREAVYALFRESLIFAIGKSVV